MSGPTLARTRAALERHRGWFAIAAAAVVVSLGLAALHLILAEVHLRDVRHALAAVPAARIAAAIALTAVSYTLLTVYDHTGLRLVGKPQPWRTSALGSSTAYALSHNLGLSAVTATSARYRVYSAAGLSLGEVVQVASLGAIAFWSGVALASGAALLALDAPLDIAGMTIGLGIARVVGVLSLVLALVLPVLRATGRRSIGVGDARIPVPGLRDYTLLACTSVLDLAVASAALFVLIPGLDIAAYPAFFVAYCLAIVIALLAHVPGGLGVFEAVVLAALPAPKPMVFAGLLLFRLTYYILPLFLASAAIAVGEGRRLRQPLARGIGIADRVGRALAPSAVTLLVFGAGLILLVSGALPGVKGRLADLDTLLPLPFIEGSHLGSSLVGTALLLIAPALHARLRSGFLAARPLLLAGAAFSLLKGLDYEEATVQLAVLLVLQYARPAFYRRGNLSEEPLDWRWLGAALGAIALSVWAGFFAYKRVPYSDDLWWHFALRGNAPRFLRATFGAGILLTGTAFWHLLSGRRRSGVAEELPPDVAATALSLTERTDANLAFTGDKSFVVSAAGDAFIMYRVQGATWIVMGDPVGPQSAWSELVWAIRRRADAAHARLSFYQASAAMLPLLVDLGLEVMKYGEEANVPLATFSLQGPQAKDFRHALRRAEQNGITVEIVPVAAVPALLPELQAVSDAWLDDKGGREKRFSLGPFAPDYLTRFPCIVVRQAGATIAFANIWTAKSGGELSVDLMRHRPDAPPGTMDLMFVRLFEWGKEQGYAWFNLGLAPLSGLPRERLAPLWAKVGRLVFENGGRFYGFAGLRAFKAKFRPEWRPRYIAVPRGVPRVATMIALMRAVNA